MSHTKGPWAFEPSFFKGRAALNLIGDGMILAQGIEFTSWSEGKNAKLVKAAPDLLEALQLAQALLIVASNTPPSSDKRWTQIADALAKATGAE